jgi:formylglycine-generating enzyme required for sulfatase activity
LDGGIEKTTEGQSELQREAEATPEVMREARTEVIAEAAPELQREAETTSEVMREARTEVAVEAAPEITPELPAQPNEVLIPAGTFTMGSPTTELGRGLDDTQYQVTLTRSFFMQKYEVTQSEFQARMGYNPSSFSSCGGNCPVERVNWYEAAAYSNAASRAAGLAECFTCTGSGASVTCSVAAAYTGANYYNCLGYRLPTEAEWEYAYRAGTSTAFYNGGITSTGCFSLDANADAIAWYKCNAQSKTHPVGGKQPNAWGLYDMAGNVWEWCYDWYDDYSAQAATDPVGAATGANRVIRGGVWSSYADGVRAARRSSYTPTFHVSVLGFRVVRSSP